MLRRLRDDWVYGGFLAALMLLVLTPALANGWSLALTLVWLHLPIYMLHQYEEHDGDRFRLFINAEIGGGHELLTPLAVFVINIGGVWGVDAVAFCLAALGHVGFGLTAIYLSLINGVSHCVMAAVMRKYNPGLFTSVLLFIPAGAATLWVLRTSTDVTLIDHAVGFGIALLIHAAIVVLIVARKLEAERPVR